jgi:hypothetical protein
MPNTAADPLRCSFAVSEPGTEPFQQLAPDPFAPRARDARGRFAQGQSGNPRGRPPGIRNPTRRLPDLLARPLGRDALSRLIDRKPHLLRPLAARLLPPPLAALDPADRLGIDLSSIRSATQIEGAMRAVIAALAQGTLSTAEAAGIARRARTRLRALRRLARLQQRAAPRAATPAEQDQQRPRSAGLDPLPSGSRQN